MGIDARVFAVLDGNEMHESPIMTRWFSKGYTRGYWPEIRSEIERLKAEHPNAKVYYMSDDWDFDQRDDFFLATPKRVAQLDSLWNEIQALGEQQ